MFPIPTSPFETIVTSLSNANRSPDRNHPASSDQMHTEMEIREKVGEDEVGKAREMRQTTGDSAAELGGMTHQTVWQRNQPSLIEQRVSHLPSESQRYLE